MNIYFSTLEKLKSLAESKYAEFSSKIANCEKQMLGVRIPTLRQIAKEIYFVDYNSYLDNCSFKYFEDTMIYGLVIANLGFEEFLKYLPVYLSNVDSWSHIDSFVPSIKSIKANEEKFLQILKERINNASGFTLRFYIICLMDFYLKTEYLNYVFGVCESYDGQGYYNDMAIAWLISVAFVKFKDKTFNFIKNCKLSSFTLNKSISKIKDSFRVSREDKILLQNYIRKK